MIPLYEPITYSYIIYYKTYFLLCLVSVSQVSFLSDMLNNLYINQSESYMSFKYHKWDLLWYKKIIILYLSRSFTVFLKISTCTVISSMLLAPLQFVPFLRLNILILYYSWEDPFLFLKLSKNPSHLLIPLLCSDELRLRQVVAGEAHSLYAKRYSTDLFLLYNIHEHILYFFL